MATRDEVDAATSTPVSEAAKWASDTLLLDNDDDAHESNDSPGFSLSFPPLSRTMSVTLITSATENSTSVVPVRASCTEME